ncbi:MAG TPA: hypothetical protein VNA65_02685 [Candidatus Dormibacteraeota bacterium]|nr:hypothetical protein [Candidatus Dormibacteraeota bacterium]
MQTAAATATGEVDDDPKSPIHRVVVAGGQIGSKPAVMMMMVVVVLMTAIAHS